MNWKIWLLIICILGSLLAIFPLDFSNGLEITNVDLESEAFLQGLRPGMKITNINGQLITNLDDYRNSLIKFPTIDPEKLSITTDQGTFILFINNTPEISVKKIPKHRIKTGLDLSGGARALIKAEGKELTNSELNDLISVTEERLNVYGLNDVQIKSVRDLSGNNFMLVEIAGSTPEELETLIGQQGKFEAKIGNDTVFEGGEKDITYVARTGDQSGIYTCSQYEGGFICQFRFSISLSPAAAKNHADITCALGSDPSQPQYLDQPLELFLDDVLVNSLFIGKDLKCSETTQIQISGSGTGATEDEAFKNAEIDMKQLQTVMISGSLPFKLQIEKLDTISPLLGKEFTNTIIIAGIAAILAVGLAILIRYRKIKLSLAVLLTSLSEVLIILGVSALFNRSLDLPAIAGIIAAIGTGVDSQIIILDEVRMMAVSLRERIKRALTIIMGTYVTTLFALLPLMWAGAGLLQGFAITTIIGISVGVFITRPAFSEIVRKIMND
jgi:preprotein translocase subunit SecD